MTGRSSTKPSDTGVLTINDDSPSIKSALYRTGEDVMSTESSRVSVRVIHTDEESMIAEAVCRILGLARER